MPIHCICPNGHRLVVHERYAGVKIRCVKCREAVRIPRAEDGELTDTCILQILGEFNGERAKPTRANEHSGVGERECPRCRRPVPTTLRVCPSCNVYLPLVGKAAS